jgi:hypothetical protein
MRPATSSRNTWSRQRNAEATVNRLIQTLDNVRLAEALERLEKQYRPKVGK